MWLPEGGFCYTLDAKGKIKVRERFWWPVTAIGAISVLQQADPQEEYENGIGNFAVLTNT